MTQARSELSKLHELLEGLVKTYRSLLQVVRQERDLLESADLDGLSENNKAKEKVLLKIRNLETLRLQVVTRATENLPPRKEPWRLLDIANQVGGAEGEKLRNMHSVLNLLIKRVRDLNEQNENLVQSALTSVTGAMKSIRDTLQDKPTYGRKDKKMHQPVSEPTLVSKDA